MQHISEPTHQTLDEIDGMLAPAGSAESHFVWVEIWFADTAKLERMNAFYAGWLDRDRVPVRACVQSSLSELAAKVEIMVTLSTRVSGTCRCRARSATHGEDKHRSRGNPLTAGVDPSS